MEKLSLLLFIIIPLLLPTEETSHSDVIDLYIENVLILDGSGYEAFKGNVGIVGDQIVYVSEEPMDTDNVTRIIDGQGRHLAPGFIDMHSHGNPSKTPQFENFLAMGVTTISLGQDGSSPSVTDLGVWQKELQREGLGPNIVMFLGHGTLRNLAGVGNELVPTDAGIDSMKTLLMKNLPYVFGMSTGLEYNPGLNAGPDELVELAAVVGKADRMISSHMRNEDDDAILESIEELIAQGKHCQVHISHLKSVYGKGEERGVEILDFIKKAQKEGVKITADVYPYTASYTGIGILFPEWANTKEQFTEAKKERRAELEKYLRERVMARNGPEATLLGTDPYTGKTLANLESESGKPFEQILIDDIGPDEASAAYFVMDEELQTSFIKDPMVAFCSDGSPTGFHPRGHGTFARIIEEYVVKRRELSLAEAVRKMTSYPASIFGIEDRGVIAENMKADVVLFYPQKVTSNAEYHDPLQLAQGFDLVIVNGKIVRENGEMTGILPGEFLKP